MNKQAVPRMDDGGTAYPVPASGSQPGYISAYETWNQGFAGMTLRDYFAGQALATLIARFEGGTSIKANQSAYAAFARDAYAFADAMIAAKRRTEGSTNED